MITTHEPNTRHPFGPPEGIIERRQPAIAQSTACHLFGIGTSESFSETNNFDRRIGAEGSSVATENASIVENGSIGIGPEGQFNEAGAIGGDLQVSGNFSVQNSDSDLIRDTLGVIKHLVDGTNGVLAEAASEGRYLASEAVSGLEGIKAVELTGGASVWKWAVIVAILGWVATKIFKKR